MVRPTIKTEPSCSSPLIISDDEIDSFTSPSENSSDTKQGSGPVKQEFLDTTDGLAEASSMIPNNILPAQFDFEAD